MTMKMTRSLLFKLGAIAVLLIIGAVMMVIGRGHSIYLDDKTFESGGIKYDALYRVDVSVEGSPEEPQNLYARERVVYTKMGQTATINIQYMEAKGGEKKPLTVKIRIPYSMDGVVINLPALIAGEGPEVYMSEFVTVPDVSTPDSDVVITDEFSMTDI